MSGLCFCTWQISLTNICISSVAYDTSSSVPKIYRHKRASAHREREREREREAEKELPGLMNVDIADLAIPTHKVLSPYQEVSCHDVLVSPGSRVVATSSCSQPSPGMVIFCVHSCTTAASLEGRRRGQGGSSKSGG